MSRSNKFKSAKEAELMMKELIKNPISLKDNDFIPGKMILFSYNAKLDKNPYDSSPLAIVLRRSSKYTLGVNFNWCPPKYREKVISFILNKNKNNINKGLDIELDYKMIKRIIKGLGPIVRLYINERISKKGVIVPSYLFQKTVKLRSEGFIGISSARAWNIAVNKKRKKR